MSLKSFPLDVEERRVIWCLSEHTIDKALQDDDSKKMLGMHNLTIVQLPVSRFAKRKSFELAELDDKGLLREDQILVIDEDDLSTDKKYLNLEKLVENFLDSNLTKANHYSRFFAALGATEFSFVHENKDFSDFNSNLEVGVDGLASKVSNVDIELKSQITSALEEMASISKKFKQIECNRDERIQRAENILHECNLENDKICSKELAAYKDGSADLTELSIRMSSTAQQSKSFDALLNLGLKLPKINSSESTDNVSLASFKSKLEVAQLVKKSFDFNLIVKF